MTWQSDSRSFTLTRILEQFMAFAAPKKPLFLLKSGVCIRKWQFNYDSSWRHEQKRETQLLKTDIFRFFWIHFLRDFRFSVFFFSFRTLSTSFNRFWSFFSDEDEFVDESESEELEDELEELSRLRRFFDLLLCVFGRLRRLEDRDDLELLFVKDILTILLNLWQ